MSKEHKFKIHITRRDVQGHITSSLQLKNWIYTRTENETERISQVVKAKDLTSILDRPVANVAERVLLRELWFVQRTQFNVPINGNCTTSIL